MGKKKQPEANENTHIDVMAKAPSTALRSSSLKLELMISGGAAFPPPLQALFGAAEGSGVSGGALWRPRSKTRATANCEYRERYGLSFRCKCDLINSQLTVKVERLGISGTNQAKNTSRPNSRSMLFSLSTTTLWMKVRLDSSPRAMRLSSESDATLIMLSHRNGCRSRSCCEVIPAGMWTYGKNVLARGQCCL